MKKMKGKISHPQTNTSSPLKECMVVLSWGTDFTLDILPNILMKVLVLSVAFIFEDTMPMACCNTEEPSLEATT